jgi:hypothetical protein
LYLLNALCGKIELFQQPARGQKKYRSVIACTSYSIGSGYLFLVQRGIIIIKDCIYKRPVIKPEESSCIIGFIREEYSFELFHTFDPGCPEW